jgi:hypothetical protein
MGFLRIDRLLALLTHPDTLTWILWGGFGLITIVLLLLMRTRWGQYKPLRKCVILSLLAHILLAGYSTTVRLAAMTTSRPEEPTMKVSSLDGFVEKVSDEESPRPQDKPWEKFADEAPRQAEPLDLAQPTPDPANDPQRAVSNDMPELLRDPQLPQPRQAEFSAPRPSTLTADQAERPTDAAASSEQIEATPAQRRDRPDEPKPERPDLARAETENEPAPAARPERAPGVPSALLEQPTLPPQLAEARVVEAPASARPGVEADELRRNTPASPEMLTDANRGAPATDEGNASAAASGRQAAPSGAGETALADAGASAGPLVEVQPRLGPASASMRRNSPSDQEVPELFRSRMEPDRKSIIAIRGGTQETEGAVQAALAWLAASQDADGRWSAAKYGAGQEAELLGRNRQGAGKDGDMAVTGLALLAFLGAGHTHQEGAFQESVRRGLEFLIRSQEKDGNLGGGAQLYAFMYCHGMATFALSEAYGMTRDQRLEGPLRKAVAWSLKAQHPTNGGWRYKPGDPVGDTSQLGWQLMALKSADLAGIELPARSREGMVRFLKSVQSGTYGGLASYRPTEKVTRTMTAEALVCRQLLGMSRANPASDEAGAYIIEELPGQGPMNLYYWYYGTLATFHLQGEHWDRWNEALKEALISTQVSRGENSGSWDPDDAWGRHGGRIFSTALAALCLEVYYRYLPIYTHGQAGAP